MRAAEGARLQKLCSRHCGQVVGVVFGEGAGVVDQGDGQVAGVDGAGFGVEGTISPSLIPLIPPNP